MRSRRNRGARPGGRHDPSSVRSCHGPARKRRISSRMAGGVVSSSDASRSASSGSIFATRSQSWIEARQIRASGVPGGVGLFPVSPSSESDDIHRTSSRSRTERISGVSSAYRRMTAGNPSSGLVRRSMRVVQHPRNFGIPGSVSASGETTSDPPSACPMIGMSSGSAQKKKGGRQGVPKKSCPHRGHTLQVRSFSGQFFERMTAIRRGRTVRQPASSRPSAPNTRPSRRHRRTTSSRNAERSSSWQSATASLP